jgi:hypothetical protein
MFAILAGRPTASRHQVVPRGHGHQGPDQISGNDLIEVGAQAALRRDAPGNCAGTLQTVIEPILPSLLGRWILTAEDFDGVDDRFVAGIQTSLHVDEGQECIYSGGGIADFRNLLNQASSPIDEAEEPDEQVRLVLEDQIERLARQPSLLGYRPHGNGTRRPLKKVEGRRQDAGSGRRWGA